MKVDLHVHTRESHSAPEHWLAGFLGVRESYTQPHAALAEALGKGLDAVAVTNHDSAGEALALARERPGRVIPGCEYTVYGGRGRYAHVVVLGIDEKGHEKLARERRRGIARFTDLARGEGYAYFLAHPAWEAGHEKRGIDPEALCDWLEHFDVIEVLNGHCGAENEIARGLAEHFGKARVGGSDSHALNLIGATWTESPARTVDGFLDDLRAGNVRAGGSAGGTSGFASTAREVLAAFYRHELLKAVRRARRPDGAPGEGGGARRPGVGQAIRTAVELFVLPGFFWAPQLGTRSYLEKLRRKAEELRRRLVDHLELELAREAAGAPAAERSRRWAEGMGRIRAAFPDARAVG